MEAQIEKLNKELETRTDYESDSYMALIEEVSALSEKFYSIDATNYEEDVEKALLGLGFTRSDFQRQTPDVLLLDEPTNHLDIESIQWLEDFLINNGKAVIVISHDRKFVDNITTRTIEVTMGRIYDYKVNYSQYLQLRKDRREQQQKAYDEQQPCQNAGEAGITRSGRGGYFCIATEIPAFTPFGQLSSYHGRCWKGIRRESGVPQR